MSESPPIPLVRRTYSQADLVQEFVTEPQWTQSQVADKMQDLAKELPTELKGMLVPVTYSCLSRWKRSVKPVPRAKFIAVALASGRLEWESSGRHGPAPELSDVLGLWEERHRPSPFRAGSDRFPEPRLNHRLPHPPPADADFGDASQIRALRAYGPTGLNLLMAARAGDNTAALDFALLRTLDGHRQEGEYWLRTAYQTENESPDTTTALPRITVDFKAPLHDLARAAFDRSRELEDDPHASERRALLLEKAAGRGDHRAVDHLASHFDRLGDVGAAARWRAAAPALNRTPARHRR